MLSPSSSAARKESVVEPVPALISALGHVPLLQFVRASANLLAIPSSEALFMEFDRNRDGQVDFGEFRRALVDVSHQ